MGHICGSYVVYMTITGSWRGALAESCNIHPVTATHISYLPRIHWLCNCMPRVSQVPLHFANVLPWLYLKMRPRNIPLNHTMHHIALTCCPISVFTNHGIYNRVQGSMVQSCTMVVYRRPSFHNPRSHEVQVLHHFICFLCMSPVDQISFRSSLGL